MSKEIIREVVSGNGNNFTGKEILQAHIIDDKEFKKEIREEFKYVREQFGKGTGKIKEIREGQKSIKSVLKYGIGPIILFILGWLSKFQFINK